MYHTHLDLLNSLLSIGVDNQDTSARAVGTPALTSGDVPGVADHQLEVVIRIDVGGKISVVAAELARGDFSILIFAIEGIQELSVS
jgi:hypothetical protein